MKPEHVSTLRALKGAPASILLALMLANKSLGTADLATYTGYNRKTIGSGLLVLQSLEAITNANRYHGWQLSPTFKQLILPGFQLGEVEGYILPLDPTTTITTLGRQINSEKEIGVGANGRGKFYPSLTPDQKERSEILAEFQIGEPKRSILALRDHLTPAHIEKAYERQSHRAQKSEKNYHPGWLITALEDIQPGDPPCTCGRCSTCRRDAFKLLAARETPDD